MKIVIPQNIRNALLLPKDKFDNLPKSHYWYHITQYKCCGSSHLSYIHKCLFKQLYSVNRSPVLPDRRGATGAHLEWVSETTRAEEGTEAVKGRTCLCQESSAHPRWPVELRTWVRTHPFAFFISQFSV